MKNIFYNHSDNLIFISITIKNNLHNFPEFLKQRIIIRPGEGIDMGVLNLKKNKPKKTKN